MYVFSEPWQSCDMQELVKELERELSNNPAHCLYGRKVKLVGRHRAMDCFLFELIDGIDEHTFADVHLTFSPEIDPGFPSAQLYKNFEAFAEGRMNADAWDESSEGWPEGWLPENKNEG